MGILGFENLTNIKASVASHLSKWKENDRLHPLRGLKEFSLNNLEGKQHGVSH